MKLVTQRERSDCGVACVAMLLQRYRQCPAGSSYDAARAAMSDFNPELGSDTRYLRRGLRKFDIRIAHRSFRFRPSGSLDMGLDFDALIATRMNKNEWYHWMVWDSVSQVLLDPSATPYKRPPVEWYLRVLGDSPFRR
jgi:ABC-type bacteriocin/lantibiotic exporter with double-glycine peptidase domain